MIYPRDEYDDWLEDRYYDPDDEEYLDDVDVRHDTIYLPALFGHPCSTEPDPTRFSPSGEQWAALRHLGEDVARVIQYPISCYIAAERRRTLWK